MLFKDNSILVVFSIYFFHIKYIKLNLNVILLNLLQKLNYEVTVVELPDENANAGVPEYVH